MKVIAVFQRGRGFKYLKAIKAEVVHAVMRCVESWFNGKNLCQQKYKKGFRKYVSFLEMLLGLSKFPGNTAWFVQIWAVYPGKESST